MFSLHCTIRAQTAVPGNAIARVLSGSRCRLVNFNSIIVTLSTQYSSSLHSVRFVVRTGQYAFSTDSPPFVGATGKYLMLTGRSAVYAWMLHKPILLRRGVQRGRTALLEAELVVEYGSIRELCALQRLLNVVERVC